MTDRRARMGFTGWPKSVFAFYEGLEADNSRAYWLAHKATYDEDVKEPFAALSAAVEKEFGPMRVFRPNRDTRFAKDKSPYKTQAAAVTEGRSGTHFYVSIGAEGLYVGSGYYMLMPDQLERYRDAVADNRTGPPLVKAVAAVRAAKLECAAHDEFEDGTTRLPEGPSPRRVAALEGIARRQAVPGRAVGVDRGRARSHTRHVAGGETGEHVARQARRAEHSRAAGARLTPSAVGAPRSPRATPSSAATRRACCATVR